MWNPLKNMSQQDWDNLRNSNIDTSMIVSPSSNNISVGLTNAFPNGSSSSKTPDNTNVGVLEGLGNTLTGNVDFQRQLALQEYNNSFNAEQAQITRDFNAQENQIQRDWYERMANSSYQRQVKDMQNAGLNPYVSLSTGSPVAYGTSASVSSPTATSVGVQHSGQGIQALAGIANTALSLGAKSSQDSNNSLTYLLTKLIAKLV